MTTGALGRILTVTISSFLVRLSVETGSEESLWSSTKPFSASSGEWTETAVEAAEDIEIAGVVRREKAAYERYWSAYADVCAVLNRCGPFVFCYLAAISPGGNTRLGYLLV